MISALPDYDIFSFKQKNSNKLANINPNLSRNFNTTGTNYTESEIERMKLCGILFERKTVVNQELLKEFFRREPCLYNQVIYKNAARIYHCLKADLNENPILKSLKQQQAIERGIQEENKQIAEVPKINYLDIKEKKNTLQLAFSTLKFQKILEDLLDECQFYGNYSEFKDEQSLVCTILFDYMMRKFEIRDKLIEEPFDNQDILVTNIEKAIHKEKTDLAAELARNRIKADASTLEELLPKELREVDQHKAELPLYCWVNQLKINLNDMIEKLIHIEELHKVEVKTQLAKKCFMVDPHCPNLLMFHFALREKILNSDYIKNYELVIQDKSSCLAPHSVVKLLSKKDEVIVTNLSGGLVAAFIGCMMEEFEGKVYVYGATSDDKYDEISTKLQQIGCSKYVKLMREEFLEVKPDDPKLENAKVILINAPCSKTALMNPMEFLFQEGEDVKFLRDYTLDANNQNKVRKCIQEESTILKHAFRFPKVRAIVYQTYSKNSSENEILISKLINEFNDNRKSLSFPYKLTPPVIPLTAEDIQNDEVVKNYKFLQFKPSNKMNGCFIALLARDRDFNVNKEIRKSEGGGGEKTKLKKMSAPQPATFEEKNFLKLSNENNKANNNLINKKLTNLRRKSIGTSLPYVTSKKSSVNKTYKNLEQEIKQLQLKNKLDLPIQKQYQLNQPKEFLISDEKPTSSKNSIEPIQFKRKGSDFESRLSQIGKLDSKKLEQPNRSSTPDQNHIQKEDDFKLKYNKKIEKNFVKQNILNCKTKKFNSKPHFKYQYDSKSFNELNINKAKKQVRFENNFDKEEKGNNVYFTNITPNNSLDDVGFKSLFLNQTGSKNTQYSDNLNSNSELIKEFDNRKSPIDIFKMKSNIVNSKPINYSFKEIKFDSCNNKKININKNLFAKYYSKPSIHKRTIPRSFNIHRTISYSAKVNNLIEFINFKTIWPN